MLKPDVPRIGSAAYNEQKETGGVGAETAKVAGGVAGAWTGAFVCAAVGGKVSAILHAPTYHPFVPSILRQT